MNSSKFLIIGANGQLGRALQTKYPNAHAVDVKELDISNESAVNSFIWTGVEVILNAAAYTNVDGAETTEGQALAKKVNVNGVANLANAAKEHNLTLVHISTDYVFDGNSTAHTEDEPFSPLSIYGQTKADGDKEAAQVPKHYILRTSWVIGEGKNFVRTMLEVGRKGINSSVVKDQVGRLTFASELVRAIDHLLSNNAPYGTYNISNDGPPVSWAEVAKEIYKEAGLINEVTGISTAEYFKDKPRSAKRPLNSVLDLAKIESTGFKPRDWREDLRDYVRKETES